MSDDVLTRDNDGNLAVRTVSSTGDNYVNKDDVYTRDNEGKLCVRTTGGGSGDQHNLGYYATPEALEEAHPTAEPGDYAIVGTTDSVWVWDDDNSEWLDTGAKETSTYLPFPAGWTTTGTTKDFCDDVAADTTAVVGKAYLGEVTFSDLPASMVNGEVVVEIMSGTTSSNKVVTLTLTSGNTAPYMWKYTYWNGGENVSNWIGFQQQLVSGTNIKTVNNESLLGPGNITIIPGVPQYTTMPASSASNVGQLAQYAGETIPETQNDRGWDKGYFYLSSQTLSDPIATISQTAGRVDSASFETTVGTVVMSGTAQAVKTVVAAYDQYVTLTNGTMTCVWTDNSGGLWQVSVSDNGGDSTSFNASTYDLTSRGISIEGTPAEGDTVVCTYSVGNMYNLAVDVDTFVGEEQPTGDGTFNFVATATQESVSPQVLNFDGNTITINPSQLLSYCKMYVYNGDWTVAAYVRIVYFADTTTWQIAILDSSYNNLGDAGGINPTSAGLTYDTLPATGEFTGLVDYIAESIIWTKNGQTVSLQDYGITYSGTPVDDDVLTVDYTAPVVTGYEWKQINVQPATDIETGINWATKVDLPDTYSSSTWSSSPQYVIPGGLPDGNYKFFIQVKTKGSTNDDNSPTGLVTFVLNVKITESTGYFYGNIAPVIDGDWYPSYSYRLNDRDIWNLFYKRGSDLIIWSTDIPFVTDLAETPNIYVPECFKLSTIKNMDTGVEYTAVGIEPTNESVSFDQQLSGSVHLSYLEQQLSIPSYFYNTTFQMSDSRQYLVLGYYVSVANFHAGCSEADLSLSSDNGNLHFIVENTYNNYELTICEATGIFENAEIGYSENGYLCVKYNQPAGTSDVVGVTLGLKGSSAEANMYFDWTVTSFTPLAATKIGGTITPSILGKILQYTGATNANYTNGYFYKANGILTPVGSSVTCTETSSYGVTISCSGTDLDDLITGLSTYFGWSQDYIKDVLRNTCNWVYDIDNNTLRCNEMGSDLPAALMQYFTVSPSLPASGSLQWTTVDYTPPHDDVTSQSWDRIDVQPSSSPTIPSTMPVLAVADWSGNAQTVNVTGVTATNTVFVSPDPASAADYASAGIICTAQGAGTLTFTCATVPSNAITVNVVIL